MAKADRTYPASVVCHAAGMHDVDLSPNTLTAWRLDGPLELDDPNQSGWTRYTLNDIVRVCALAEISRFGFATKKSALLVKELEKSLRRHLGFGKPAKPEAEEPPRYLVADQVLTSGKDGSLGVGQFTSPESLWGVLDQDGHEAATAIVIDVHKLARRIRRRFLDALGADLPGGVESKP